MQFTPNQLNTKAHETADQMSHKAQEMAHDVKERAEKLAHQASEKMSEIHPQEILRDAGELIKKHPLQALAAGAIVGGLLGLLMSQRRGRRA